MRIFLINLKFSYQIQDFLLEQSRKFDRTGIDSSDLNAEKMRSKNKMLRDASYNKYKVIYYIYSSK